MRAGDRKKGNIVGLMIGHSVAKTPLDFTAKERAAPD